MVKTKDEARAVLVQAKKDWEAAETKDQAAMVLWNAGRNGVGWKHVCRVCIGGMDIEKTLANSKFTD